MHIDITSIKSPRQHHYNLIESLCNRSFLSTGHEALNEQMLLSLEQKVYGVPKDMLKAGETFRSDQNLNLGISFVCAYFGVVNRDTRNEGSTVSLSDLIRPLSETEIEIALSEQNNLSYLQLSYGYDKWYMALVIPRDVPATRYLAKELLLKGIREARNNGGGQLQLFAPMSSPLINEVAKETAFTESFTLLSMKKQLSQDPRPFVVSSEKNNGAETEKVSIRPFQTGKDENTWLELNKRAFAIHKEQGKWGLGDFLYREGKPWFDPAGLLILEIENRPSGFCWTKILRQRPVPPYDIGEIYILGLDARYRGHGLGKTLLLAGIGFLEKSGISTCYLYTDSANETAIHLYQSLDFTLDHQDKIYVLDIAE
jgi:mycothiol synthase